MRWEKGRRWLWLAALLVFILGCNQREEGCLDIEALNFDVSAEKDCDNCCNYPALFLNVSYTWQDTTFKLNTVLYRQPGDSLIFTRASILLTEVELVTEELDTLRVLDAITLKCTEGQMTREVVIPDDAVLVDRGRFDYNLGMINASPEVLEIRMKAGLPDIYQCYDPGQVTSGHPLSPSGHYATASGRAVVGRFVYSADSLMTLDTLNVDFPAKLFSWSGQKKLNFAANDTIGVTLDYFRLFEGVDLQAGEAEIQLALEANFTEFLTLRL